MNLAKAPVLKVRVLGKGQTTLLVFLPTAAGAGIISASFVHWAWQNSSDKNLCTVSLRSELIFEAAPDHEGPLHFRPTRFGQSAKDIADAIALR